MIVILMSSQFRRDECQPSLNQTLIYCDSNIYCNEHRRGLSRDLHILALQMNDLCPMPIQRRFFRSVKLPRLNLRDTYKYNAIKRTTAGICLNSVLLLRTIYEKYEQTNSFSTIHECRMAPTAHIDLFCNIILSHSDRLLLIPSVRFM